MVDERFVKKVQPRQIIKCPHCGWEYLPGDIFYPENTIGQSYNVIRDPLGHILYEEYVEGSEPLTEEHFVCENCDKPFIVELETKFRSKPEETELDFSNTAVSLF